MEGEKVKETVDLIKMQIFPCCPTTYKFEAVPSFAADVALQPLPELP